MYREASRAALFQGDLLVVPEVSLHERDPRIATFEARKVVCKKCGKRVELSRKCNHCNAQLPNEKGQTIITPLGVRQADGADPLADTSKQTSVLAKFHSMVGMISSHSCDVDRQGDICFHGVRPLSGLGSEQQKVLQDGGEISSFLLLPETGRLPACVVDFNAEFSLPFWCLGVQTTYTSTEKGGPEDALQPFAEVIEQRLASLSRNGLKKLYEARFFHQTRYPVAIPEDFQLDRLDPDRPPPNPFPRRGWSLPPPKWLKPAVD